ncbi:hypothetical protein HA402_007774 [Bradysia odoriphaga]|nr:hypothetical protein HA402_007774 [Bradysia odoriphaga]
MTADRENFLLPSNMDTNNYTRPLSAYDNLHSTSAHSPAVTTIPTQQKPSSPIHSNGNEKEFPFNNISFRFDDLPLQNQPNHFNQIRSNSTISNSNCCNGNLNKSTSQGYTTIANHNGINNITDNKTAPIPPVVNVDSDSKMLLGATKQQYENVSETVRLRNLNSNKPVISEAKSSFFGLNASSPIRDTTENMALRHNNQTSDGCGGGYEDCSPLLNNSSGNGTRNLYQNIPSNSACFDSGNQSFNNVDNTVENNQNISNDTTRDEDSSDCCADLSQNNNSSKYFADASHRMSQSPSQAVYMSTTVPQNIKGSNIMGRHTPTRNSLRHSRMIVVNKSYQTPRRLNPLEIRFPLLAKLLLIFQLICGISIGFLGIWILVWAPNTRLRDNPYWSGSALVVSGILGLILINFRRVPRQKLREHCFTFIRVNSTMITLVATLLSLAAFVFAALHLDNITSAHTTCMPDNIFTSPNAACICLFGAKNSTNHLQIQTAEEGEITVGGFEFHYRDLSCKEVTGVWKYILIGSTILNVLGFFFSFLYLLLLCFRQNGKRKPYAAARSQL